MRKDNLTALLTDLRALILKSRPAYRDFLGEVTETKTTKILENVVLAENQLMLPVADAAFSGFIAGRAYRVMLDGEEESVIAKDFSGAGVLSNVEDFAKPPKDGWALQYNSEAGKMMASTSGAFLGATISVYYDETVTEQRWSVRKLAYELLPDRLLLLRVEPPVFFAAAVVFSASAFSAAGALSRLISSNLARLRALFTLWAAAARRLVRSSSTAALASVPAAPTFCSADAILSRLLRSAALGTSRVDISSKEIVFTLLSSPFFLI